MIFGSVCSGIEAASVAWHPLGWRSAFYSEIEKFPSAVLAHHYPNVPNYGDMTKFQEWPDAAIDVLVGGTPCQSFSVAGLRKGLADPRGNLMLTYLAVAERYRPSWLVWENVPGALSVDGGQAFSTLIGGLAELGYHAAWRVLDAQFIRVDGFGRAVPQRRRRVFVVGYLGDWRRAAAVFLERESLCWDTPPRREAGKAVAPTISARPTGGGGLGTDFDCDGGLIANAVAPTLYAAFGSKLGLENQHIDGGAGMFVAHALRAEGFDVSEDGTGRGTPLVPVGFDSFNQAVTGEIAHSIRSGAGPEGVPICFSAKDYGGDAEVNLSPTLRAGGFAESHANAGVMPAIAIQERAVSENPNAGPDGAGIRDDGASYTLEARTVPQAVAFDMRGREGGSQFEGPHETANIRAASGGSSKSYVAEAWAVRRLMPIECERLQGFPDNYTLIPFRGKPAADGPRYKALGNSMAVNCMAWIGRRIQLIEKLDREINGTIS